MPFMVCNPPAVEFYLGEAYCVEQGIGHLLRRVAASILRRGDKRLEEHGLTSAQWPVLAKLQRGRFTTIACLAREAETDPGAMTRLLDRLEAKGLCKRVRSADNRREVSVELTSRGAGAISRVPATLAEVIDAHLTGFSKAERQVLEAGLQRMLANGHALRDARGPARAPHNGPNRPESPQPSAARAAIPTSTADA